MKKYIWILGLIAMAVFLYLSGETILEVTMGGENIDNQLTVVLDPGHGGDDPGKIGVNDAQEKDINLAIALKVEAVLVEKGYEVIMTRDDDGSNGLSKVEDLQARVGIINEYSPDISVSIHQNSYTEEEISGAQVFYYTYSTEGEKAATVMQDALLDVNPDNHRLAKGNDSYYLLEETEVPTIIVECGFLSNLEEANLLIQDAYQEQLATCIVNGIETYLN